MMTGACHARWPLLAAAAGFCLSCSGGSRLGPTVAAAPSGQGAAHASGVRVYADASGWMSRGAESARVTPVRIRIENDGLWPLRVRYDAVALVSAAGETFRAIPPFDVLDADRTASSSLVPRFVHQNVALAPYLASVYDGAEAEPSPMVFNYHDDVYDHWRRNLRAPPSRFMREVAMPEGWVGLRGELSGFLYFERVPERMQEVTLSLDLVNAETGRKIETVCIPLLVD